MAPRRTGVETVEEPPDDGGGGGGGGGGVQVDGDGVTEWNDDVDDDDSDGGDSVRAIAGVASSSTPQSSSTSVATTQSPRRHRYAYNGHERPDDAPAWLIDPARDFFDQLAMKLDAKIAETLDAFTVTPRNGGVPSDGVGAGASSTLPQTSAASSSSPAQAPPASSPPSPPTRSRGGGGGGGGGGSATGCFGPVLSWWRISRSLAHYVVHTPQRNVHTGAALDVEAPRIAQSAFDAGKFVREHIAHWIEACCKGIRIEDLTDDQRRELDQYLTRRGHRTYIAARASLHDRYTAYGSGVAMKTTQ